MQHDIESLDQHVIICGYGRMGRLLAAAIRARGRAVIIIDSNAERVREARTAGLLALEGNATEEEVLKAAGIEKARTLATVLRDDVANVFITITAHDLNSRLDILARAEEASTTKKLRQVGAQHVILPAAIGADRLANMILRPSAESMLRQIRLPEGLNDDLSAIGLRLDELEVRPNSTLVGDKISAIKVRGHRLGVLVVALRQANGHVLINPPASTRVAAGDCVIILAHQEDIDALCEQFALQSELTESGESSAGVK
jgi:voltage-gated potassium channel